MKKLFLPAIVMVITVLSLHSLQAQIRTPQPSPAAEVKQTVGLTEITINYSRPSAKGRVVFGDLVPLGQTWRTGANAATKFTFSDNVRLGGVDVKKGSYAVLTVPAADTWKVMLYPYESTSWGSYSDKEPAAAFTVRADKTPEFTETFTINLTDITSSSANVELRWEQTRVMIPLMVDFDERVMADIKRVMAGPSANDYYAAATYYHENKKDLDQALEWAKKGNAMSPQFWTLRREALILADLGRYQEAIATAERSMAMAKEAGNDEYVRMNKKSIDQWVSVMKPAQPVSPTVPNTPGRATKPGKKN